MKHLVNGFSLLSHDSVTIVHLYIYIIICIHLLLLKEQVDIFLCKLGTQIKAIEDEICQVLGYCYFRVMYRYRSGDCIASYDDTHCKTVTNSGMTKYRLESIMSSLHFPDNSKQGTGDRIFKVRPLFEHLNKLFSEMAELLSIIHKQLFRQCNLTSDGIVSNSYYLSEEKLFGYKLWCLGSSEGLRLRFKLYEMYRTRRFSHRW